MKAVYLERPGQVVKRQIEKPKIRDGEVLVKIRSGGVCGSFNHPERLPVDLYHIF